MKASFRDLLREQWSRKRNSGELKWVTKGGEEIPIKDMSDTHLENAINSLLRHGEDTDIFFDYRNEDAGDRI